MPRIKAGRMLDEARAGKIELSFDGWFDVTFQATGGDQEAAEQAANSYARAMLRADRVPV